MQHAQPSTLKVRTFFFRKAEKKLDETEFNNLNTCLSMSVWFHRIVSRQRELLSAVVLVPSESVLLVSPLRVQKQSFNSRLPLSLLQLSTAPTD